MSAPAEKARSPAPRMISALASRTCGLASAAASSSSSALESAFSWSGRLSVSSAIGAVALAQDERHVISPLAVSPRSAAAAISAMRS